jgi:hypothetical protein
MNAVPAGLGNPCGNVYVTEDGHREGFEPPKMFLKAYPQHCHSRRETLLETLTSKKGSP